MRRIGAYVVKLKVSHLLRIDRSAVIVRDSVSLLVCQIGLLSQVVVVAVLLQSVHSHSLKSNIVVMKDGHRWMCPADLLVDHIRAEEDTSLLDGAFEAVVVDMAGLSWVNVVAAVVDPRSHREMDWARQDDAVDDHIVVEMVAESGETIAPFRVLDPLMMSRAS